MFCEHGNHHTTSITSHRAHSAPPTRMSHDQYYFPLRPQRPSHLCVTRPVLRPTTPPVALPPTWKMIHSQYVTWGLEEWRGGSYTIILYPGYEYHYAYCSQNMAALNVFWHSDPGWVHPDLTLTKLRKLGVYETGRHLISGA